MPRSLLYCTCNRQHPFTPLPYTLLSLTENPQLLTSPESGNHLGVNKVIQNGVIGFSGTQSFTSELLTVVVIGTRRLKHLVPLKDLSQHYKEW